MGRIEHIGRATLYLGDCREILSTLGKVDAVVTDPPYGIGFAAQPTTGQRRAGMVARTWDDSTSEIVTSLPDIGPCIIWGGNYYQLPSSRGWLSWRKPDAPPSMADFELAWTNLDQNARQFVASIAATNAERVGHPTQKPRRLMRWCLDFLPSANVILDPFMGSGTTGVAAMEMGKVFVGIERDLDYFELACKRIDDAQRQGDFLLQDVA